MIPPPHLQERLQRIRSLLDQGYSYAQIAKEFNLSRERVRQICKDQLGLTHPPSPKKWRYEWGDDLTPDELKERIENIYTLNESGYTQPEIAKEYFISSYFLRKFLKKHNIILRTPQRLPNEIISQIHDLYAADFTVNEIAKKLSISTGTVVKYTHKFNPCVFNKKKGLIKLPDELTRDLRSIASREGIAVQRLKMLALDDFVQRYRAGYGLPTKSTNN